MTSSERYRFDERLFSEEGLCGEIEQSLRLIDGYFLGKALGAFLLFKHRNAYACIGRDARPHSAPLEQEVIRGLVESGIRVLSFGCAPTPLVRFAAKELSAELALSISGGSRPLSDNGVKILLEGTPLRGERARQIQNIAASGNFQNRGGGALVKAEGEEAYATRLCAGLEITLTHSQVYWHQREEWSPLSSILERLGPRNAHAWQPPPQAREQSNPVALAPFMQQTLREIREQTAGQTAGQKQNKTLGFVFNSDATELTLIDEAGQIATPNQFFPLLVQSMQAKRKAEADQAVILVDESFSDATLSYMEQQGARVLRVASDALLSQILAEREVLAAASSAGRVFFKDRYYGYDDGFYASLRLLALLNEKEEGEGTTLAERLALVPR